MSIKHFWDQFIAYWDKLYALIQGSHEQRIHALELINGLLTEEDFKRVQIEMTYGEVNRNPFPLAKDLVELYISPRALKGNIPLMEEYYNAKPSNLPNLAVYKYKSYNPNDPLIDNVVFPATETTPEYTANYTDLGYQSSTGYDAETKKPVLNLVIYVKKPLADTILRKKKVTFKNPDSGEEPITLEKWLPHNSTVIDLFLLNTIGEFHLVNDVGYIEFLPDGDPLIADGSVFCELGDLRGDIKLLEASLRVHVIYCKVCDRHQCQGSLLACSRCKKSYYCNKICQRIDYSKHKVRCIEPVKKDTTLPTIAE